MSGDLLQRIKKRIRLLRDIKHLCHILAGFSLYLLYAAWKWGDLYRAGAEFYKTAQANKNGLTRTLAINFFESPLCVLARDYYILKANAGRDRISTGAMEEYSDENLLGYGDVYYDKGGHTLETQQRGLMLPLLEKSLRDNKEKLKTVMEIGCGNGDVIARLARLYPFNDFLGVDFFVRNAQLKHGHTKNLSFMKGYALEQLEKNQLQADVVYGSSTFCVFTPKELVRYLQAIRKSNITEIILSDPVWYGYVQEKNTQAVSKHIGRSVWFHNYAGYFSQAGYETVDFDFFPYKHPKSVRPDIFIILIRGRAMASREVEAVTPGPQHGPHQASSGPI